MPWLRAEHEGLIDTAVKTADIQCQSVKALEELAIMTLCATRMVTSSSLYTEKMGYGTCIEKQTIETFVLNVDRAQLLC
jgi:hypothetical protein